MKTTLFSIALIAGLSQMGAIAAPGDGSLEAQLVTGCSAKEIGKVIDAKAFDSKKANAFLKKINAPQNAKPGETYLMLETKLPSGPRDKSMSLIKVKPTEAELKALIGRATCMAIAED